MRHFLYPYTFLGLNVSLSAYNYISATPSKSPLLLLSSPKPLKLEASTSLSAFVSPVLPHPLAPSSKQLAQWTTWDHKGWLQASARDNQ